MFSAKATTFSPQIWALHEEEQDASSIMPVTVLVKTATIFNLIESPYLVLCTTLHH